MGVKGMHTCWKKEGEEDRGQMVVEGLKPRSNLRRFWTVFTSLIHAFLNEKNRTEETMIFVIM
jgi:hypothetical protein